MEFGLGPNALTQLQRFVDSFHNPDLWIHGPFPLIYESNLRIHGVEPWIH